MTLKAGTSHRVVIVGGGVSGLSIAARLAQTGFPVTLLEASQLGFEASTRNQGWLYSGAKFANQDIRLAQICFESLETTLRFCPDCLEPQHGSMVFLFERPDTAKRRWQDAWLAAGIPFEEFPLHDLFDQLPGLSQDNVQHAYKLPDRSIRCEILLEKLAAVAENAGAEVRTDTTVARLSIENDQAVGVVTGAGEEISARLVILACNATGSSLWPGDGHPEVGGQSEFAKVALKTHLVSVGPEVGRLPFCVVDANGFNHIPHAPRSVFGSDHWLPTTNSDDEQVVPEEIDRIWEQITRFFPKLDRSGSGTIEWAGTTVQAMHVEQVEPGSIPLPTVIDHHLESPRVENLLSVFPGRATLWPHLAEETRRVVLAKIESETPHTTYPPWRLPPGS